MQTPQRGTNISTTSLVFHCRARRPSNTCETSLAYEFETGASCLLFGPPGFNWCFSYAPELVSYLAPSDRHRRAAYSLYESLSLIHDGVYHDLFVCP